MTVFVAVSQFSPDRVTYALRTAGDPLRYVKSVHAIVREADSSIPVTNVVTQIAEIDRTMSREVMFAKLCTGFAVLALLIACVGLYGTMSYSVARGRPARLESVWLWARNAAPWYGWFCAAFSYLRRWGSRSACLPRWARPGLSNRFCSGPSPMIREPWRWPVSSS